MKVFCTICRILEAGQTEAVVRDLAARHFQLELFELAVKQNVIICLGTGNMIGEIADHIP